MKVLRIGEFRKLLSQRQTTGQGRLAALDIGKKKVGVALTDETMTTIMPYGVLIRDFPSMDASSITKTSRRIERIVTEQSIIGFIVGFPLTEEGELTTFCKEIIQLMSKLEPVDMPCTFWDERNSSVGARSLARSLTTKRSYRHKAKDSLAACLIMEGFLRHG